MNKTEGMKAMERLCLSFLALIWNECCQNCFSGWTAVDVESSSIIIIRRDLITSAQKSLKSHCQKDPWRGNGVARRWQWNASVANDYSLNYKTCPAAPDNSCRQDNEKQKEHVNHHLCSGVSQFLSLSPSQSLQCLWCKWGFSGVWGTSSHPATPITMPCE